MKRALIVAAGFLAFGALVAGFYWHAKHSGSAPLLSAENAAPPAESRFAFSLLDDPRPVPNLSFVDGDGRAITLTGFRGKVVLLNIWATWCIPCREEMPTLDRLQAKLGGPGFEVVALSIDRAGLSAVRQFYSDIGIEHLALYLDSAGKTSRDLSVAGLPTTLLLDRKGRELGRLIGPAEWDSPEVLAFIRRHVERTTGLRKRPTPTRTAQAPSGPDSPLSGSTEAGHPVLSMMESVIPTRTHPETAL